MNDDFQRVGMIVLGMHRSGTSALSRSLNIMGCALPASLMPAGYGNELGHWESGAIAAFNDHILERMGSEWCDYLPIDPDWTNNPAFGDVMDRAVTMLGEDFGDSRLFVLKDPRMCRLLPFWQEAMAHSRINPRYVLMVRNPLEVAASLTKRDGMERDYGLLLWLCHVLEAERHTRGRERCFCSYDSLMEKPEARLASIAQAFSLKWPRWSPASRHELRGFLDESARHHTIPTADFLDPSLMPWVPQVANVLLRWAESGERVEDYGLLDQVWSTFSGSAAIFGDLVLTGQRVRRRYEALEKTVAAFHAIEQRMGNVDDEMNWLRNKADTADHLALELAALRQTLTANEEEMTCLRERADQVETLEALLAEQTERARNSEIALSASLERSEIVGDEIAQINETNTTLRAELLQANSQLEVALNEVLRHSQIIEQQQDELQGLREDTTSLRAQLTQMGSHLRQRQEEAEQSWAELEQARRENAALIQDLEQAGTDRDLQTKRLEEANDWVFRLAGERQAEGARAARAERSLERESHVRRSLEAELARARAQVGQIRHEMDDRLRDEAVVKAAMRETITELEQALAELRRAQQSNSPGGEAQHHLDKRTHEIVALTRILKQNQTELDVSQHQVSLAREQGNWLRAVNNEMQRHPVWWGLLPRAWRDKRFYRRLAQKGLFDRDAYLANNADVAASGIDPLRHYIMHGSLEGRTFS